MYLIKRISLHFSFKSVVCMHPTLVFSCLGLTKVQQAWSDFKRGLGTAGKKWADCLNCSSAWSNLDVPSDIELTPSSFDWIHNWCSHLILSFHRFVLSCQDSISHWLQKPTWLRQKMVIKILKSWNLWILKRLDQDSALKNLWPLFNIHWDLLANPALATGRFNGQFKLSVGLSQLLLVEFVVQWSSFLKWGTLFTDTGVANRRICPRP